MNKNNMALIIFGGVNLLLPQSAVITIEMVENIDSEVSANGAVGTLKSSEGEWPVYVLDQEFKSSQDYPPEYKYCVAVNNPGNVSFSILCEEVGSVMIEHESELKPLQACMNSATNPIVSLVYKDEKLMLLGDIEAMQNYLNLEAAA